MPAWDEKNRPKGYILGVTPGFAQFEQGDQKLTYMGFARKLTKATRLGFEFAEIDFEQLSEALEPDIGNQVKQVKRAQGIELGIHLPVEVDLTLADAFSWRYMQEQVKLGAKAAENIGAKFILFHTSSHMRPNITSLFGRPEPRQRLVGPDGTNLGDWINDNKLREWFKAKFIKVLFNAMGTAGDPSIIEFFENETSFEDARKRIKEKVEETQRSIRTVITQMKISQEEFLKKTSPTIEEKRFLQQIGEQIEYAQTGEYFKSILGKILGNNDELAKIYYNVYQYTEYHNFDNIFDYWRKQGSEAEEYVAYLVVAEKMFRDNDKMWNIVKTKDDPYELCKKATEKLGKEAKMPQFVKQIVTAVAGEYINQHLKAKGGQYSIEVKKNDNKEYFSAYDFCKDNKIHIFIETAMPERGGEGGELRIIEVNDHINILKAIDNGENISYCMDFEHLITNLIDPIKESENVAKGDGRHIRMIHINAPRPITGAHAPLEALSLDMMIVYKWMYNLRKAGMQDAYVLWEMGSYGVRQSAIAFRNIINELQKDTEPKELPPEFFGINDEMRARQMVAINQHALEPLKGLLMMPEEDWTMLGEAARKRGHGAEWERRKYR